MTPGISNRKVVFAVQDSNGYVIFTDTAADLPEKIMQAYEITAVPLHVFLKNSPAVDFTLRGREFFSALRSGETVCTSAATLSRFRDMFSEALDTGKDIVYLSFSSAMSCMYQSARIAAGELSKFYPERRILIADTLCAGMGEGLLVYLAAKKRKEGLSPDELLAYITETRRLITHWIAVDDPRYLRSGGRLSAVSAAGDRLFRWKPVLGITAAGKLKVMRQVHSRKKVVRELAAQYKSNCSDRSAPVFIAQADAEEAARALKALLRDTCTGEIITAEMGPVTGAHTGPGTLALFYLGADRG